MSPLPHPSASPPELASLLASATELLRDGRPAEAIAPLREAASLDRTNASLQHDLGLACLEAGLLDEAIAAFREAIANDPHYPNAFLRLGIALERSGDSGEAVWAYDRATELQPSFTEAWFRAGALVFTLGHRDEAIGCFRRASATGGNSPLGRLGKARALLTANRNAEGEKVLRHIVALDPGNAMAHDLLGNLLAEAGRFDEARVCFARAVAAAPLLAGSYYELVRCRPVTREDTPLLEEMQRALDTPGLEEAARLRLHLAIGKAAEDRADYAFAMQQFDAADSLRRTLSPFDEKAFAAEIDRLIARFTPALLKRSAELGSADATPVFILGMPRSGTTLVEQIVSAHPAVSGAGELPFWTARGQEWYRAGAPVEASFIAAAARDYLTLLHTLAPKADRVTDKMPFNFLWAGLIHLAFPRALLIHCRRSAIDTALSIHQTYFHPSLAFPTGGPELVAYLAGYRRLTDHWRSVLPPERFLEVDYEELTARPEPLIRRLIAATGLPWHDACLRPESNPRAVNTPSKWQTRQPIYRTSVARWRRFAPFLGPLAALAEEDAPAEFNKT